MYNSECIIHPTLSPQPYTYRQWSVLFTLRAVHPILPQTQSSSAPRPSPASPSSFSQLSLLVLCHSLRLRRIAKNPPFRSRSSHLTRSSLSDYTPRAHLVLNSVNVRAYIPGLFSGRIEVRWMICSATVRQPTDPWPGCFPECQSDDIADERRRGGCELAYFRPRFNIPSPFLV